MWNSHVNLTFIFGFQKIHSHSNRDCFEIVMEKIIVILDNTFSYQRKSRNSDPFWENQGISFCLRGNQGILFHIKYKLIVMIFLYKKKARAFGARIYKINLKMLACVFDAKMLTKYCSGLLWSTNLVWSGILDHGENQIPGTAVLKPTRN